MKIEILNPPGSIRRRLKRIPLFKRAYAQVRERLLLPRRVERERRKFADFGVEKPRLFKNVLLETINICNSDCTFCPVNFRVNPKSRELMPMELINRIADELAELRWRGRISLYNNGEPLADPRIVDIVRLFSERCPEASTRILTNGILLKRELLLRLMDAGLTRLDCNSYADGRSLIGPLQRLADEPIPEHPDKVVRIRLRRRDEVLESRGGNAPNKQIQAAENPNLRRFCDYPFKQIVVLNDGSVPLCCMDVFNSFTVGNANRQSLLEIWNASKQLHWARERLLESDRSFTGVCARCDYQGCKGA